MVAQLEQLASRPRIFVIARAARPPSALLVPLLTLLLTHAVHADPAATNEVHARELFARGLTLKDQGKWQEACPKFHAAMRLYPAVAIQLNIAECYAQDSKFASALSALLKARGMLPRSKLDEQMRSRTHAHIDRQIGEVEPKVARLAITITNQPIPAGLEITTNGNSVPVEALGESLPVDPGQVQVVASAPGLRAHQSLQLASTEKRSIKLTLQPVAEPPPIPLPPAAAPPAPHHDPDKTENSVPVWVWITGALGLAASGVAVGFTVDYASTTAELDDICHGNVENCVPDDPSFDPSGHDTRKNRDLALGITFGVAGGSAVLAAIIGLATAGPERSASAPGPTDWFFAVNPSVDGWMCGGGFRF